jgi:hypothetical protein
MIDGGCKFIAQPKPQERSHMRDRGRERWHVARAVRVAVVVAASGSCTTPFGNKDRGSIHATVYDENNLGIGGVILTKPMTIQLNTTYKDSAQTAADGTASFAVVETGSVPVTVIPNASATAANDPLTKNVQVVKSQTSEVRFVLRRR